MRIAIDTRELCGKPTGVGRYLAELLAEWAHQPEAARHEWMLYAPAVPAVPDAFAHRVRVLPGTGGTQWEQWTLARALTADRPDVLFAPGYSAPLTAPCPTVVVVHDVSFAARPEWFSRREGLRRRVLTRWSARRARVVLTGSQFSKREIIRHLGIPEARIQVIAYGVRRPAAGAAAAPREPRVLYVGTILPRRHVDALLDAFVRHVAPALPHASLDIVGERRLPAGVTVGTGLAGAAADVRARVRFRSYVDASVLEDLYGRAAAFVFLSEYEGFGLTPLEAMAHGLPPVVLDTTVAREIYGEAAVRLPLDDRLVPSLGAVLLQLLTDDAMRARLAGEAARVLSRYDWSRTAAATLAALEDAAGAR